MAKSRSTFGKRDREMAKMAKANAKRARRDARAEAEPVEPTVVDAEGSSADELVERLGSSTMRSRTIGSRSRTSTRPASDLIDRIALIMASE